MEDVMVVDLAKIARLEKELEEARRELLREDGERYRILMRDIAKDEKERILGNSYGQGRADPFRARGSGGEEEGSGNAPRRSGRGSDVFILRKDRAYQKGFGAARGETA